MKLIQITNRYYALFTVVILTIAFLLVFYSLKSFSAKQEKVNLILRSNQIILQIKNGGSIPSLPPYIVVEESAVKTHDKYVLNELQLLNPYEDEKELFNELICYKNIGSKCYKISIRNECLDSDDFYLDIILNIVFIFIFLMVSLFIINFGISKKIWKPFYANLLIIKKIKFGEQKSIELKKSTIDEFKQLNQAIEELVVSSQIEYSSLKEFTENASHELQTPLAILKTNLENLIQEININEKQAKVIQNIELALKRMTTLNKNLLLLAKIDNNQFEGNEMVDISVVLNNQLAFYEELIASKKLILKSEVTPHVEVRGNKSLLETLISNLINNSIKHNFENGVIEIKLNPEYIEISNHGEPLNINPDLLFQRFKKLSKQNHSIGLGLAIVSAICNYFNWQKSYRYENDMHTIRINFSTSKLL